MTYKTGQKSVRAVYQHFQNPKSPRPLGRRRRNLAHVYSTSMGLRTQLLGSGILNFGPSGVLGHLELTPVWKDDPHRVGCLLLC